MKFVTNNQKETEKIGEKLAKLIISGKLKRRILALEGELGGGKTTFLKGFAKGLKIREKISSPTFILMRRFKIKNSKFENFYHIDCYRIENEKEILNLGLKEILQNPKNIVAIEWADKIRALLPRKTIFLFFEILGKTQRKITLKNFPKRLK